MGGRAGRWTQGRAMNDAPVRWYQPPVVWLGVTILTVSLAACIALIIVSTTG